MPGKTIKLYIAGEELKILKTAELSQWTGKARDSFHSHSYYPLRQKIEHDNFLVKSKYENVYILNEDIDFSSPSAAASIVKYRATNGKKEWKLENGINLDDYENSIDNIK